MVDIVKFKLRWNESKTRSLFLHNICKNISVTLTAWLSLPFKCNTYEIRCLGLYKMTLHFIWDLPNDFKIVIVSSILSFSIKKSTLSIISGKRSRNVFIFLICPCCRKIFAANRLNFSSLWHASGAFSVSFHGIGFPLSLYSFKKHQN